MDMIEIDPKLFVTCRLCLEDLGQYQIVPVVQEQIKYCYDIDVSIINYLYILFRTLLNRSLYGLFHKWLFGIVILLYCSMTLSSTMICGILILYFKT